VASSDLDRFARALWTGRVSFSEVAGAWLHLHDRRAPPAERELFGLLFPALLDAYRKAYGGRVSCAFFPEIRAAVALNTGGSVFSVDRETFDPGDQIRISADTLQRIAPWWRSPPVPLRAPQPELGAPGIQLVLGAGALFDPVAMRLLMRADAQQRQAVAHLTRAGRHAALMRIYGLMTTILAAVEGRTDSAAARTDATLWRSLEHELDRAEELLAAEVQREAQVLYSSGMVFGFVALGLALGAVIVFEAGTAREIASAALAGALGAAASVLSRLTAGGLGLSAETRRSTLRYFGALRPGVGAAFGGMVWVAAALIFGSSIDADNVRHLAGLLAVGFIAGFGERFAQDVLVTTPKAGITDDAAAFVVRAAGSAVRSGWRRAPKEEVAAFLRQAVSSSLNEVVAGPKLVNWSGYVHAEFEGGAPHEGGPEDGPVVVVQGGAAGTLRVIFTTHPSHAPSECPIDIADGMDADTAEFRLLPTSDHLSFEVRATDARVRRTGETTVSLPFTAPAEPGRHPAWVQILQRNRTMQVVTATVVVKEPVMTDAG
jgi:hypothetical protein